jgi:hypothetical protein
MSWCVVMMEEPGVVSPQLSEVLFSWHFLLDVSALRDNSKVSLSAPDVRSLNVEYLDLRSRK